jgi:hypothetical protein
MATDYPINNVFLALRDQCQWLDVSYTTFCALYTSGEETKTVLRKTAPAFFYEHNRVLHQHFILHACKLTDDATTGKKRNLTFLQVNSMLIEHGLMTAEIDAITTKLAEYRGLIKNSRHWVVSHFDLDTTMADEPVGAHEKEDLTDFLYSMYQYTDAVGIVLGIGPLDYRSTAGPGDASDLVMHLKNSLNHPKG